MGEKWYPAKEPMQLGNRLVPAVRRHTKDGKETGEPRPSSSYRQPIHGPKIHGGHCCYCNCELEPMSNESHHGFCDECGKAHGDLS
jgi:hypothetical protein